MYLVSVIIPTYKPGNYLFECIESLRNQTIDKSLFEIIIVLNGPKYPYLESIERFIENINEISIRLVYVETPSVSRARNKGMEVSSGKNIGFIDDDDLVSKTYLESLLFVSRPNSIACSNVKTFKNDINQLGKDYLTDAYEKNKDRVTGSLYNYKSFFSTSCAKLIPREILKDKFFNIKFSLGEDALFLASVSDKINNVYLASEDSIYYRRLREGSASRKKKRITIEIKTAFNLMIEYFKIYWNSPLKYNLLFFISRELAVLKGFAYRIISGNTK